MVHFNEARRIAALLGSTALFTTLWTGLAQADRQIIAPDILVSAPAGPAPIEQVGSSVSVITADDIERRQYRTVGEALQGVPGLHIVQSGSKGSVTSVFSRGGNSNHTLVLLNGIEINDPGAPAGAFDFSTLTTENVERIEVIRGPQSGLYGSAALGGVINIITKKGEGALRTSVRAELAAPKTGTAPIGTEVQTLKGQAVLTSEAVRPAIALAQTAAARIVQNSMAPALSMQNPAPARAPSDPPPVGARPISQFEGSVVGSIKSSELWYQSSLAAGRDETGFRDPSMLKAFQDASQLRHIDPAQQIVSGFRNLSQPYHTMMEALLLLNPAIVSALTAKIPKANSSFGIGLMFFFLCLRHGGIRRWLGQNAEREFELHEMEEMLDYLDQQVFPRIRDIPGYGKWAVAVAPFMLKELSQFVWAVQESITGHRSRLPVHRFALQLPFERLGPVQFSGHVIGQTIDILCLTPRPLPSGLEETLRRNVPAIIAPPPVNGGFGFSYDSWLWIPFVKNLSLDRAV